MKKLQLSNKPQTKNKEHECSMSFAYICKYMRRYLFEKLVYLPVVLGEQRHFVKGL